MDVVAGRSELPGILSTLESRHGMIVAVWSAVCCCGGGDAVEFQVVDASNVAPGFLKSSVLTWPGILDLLAAWKK